MTGSKTAGASSTVYSSTENELGKLFLPFCSLLCTWIVRQASPIASLHEILCRNTPGLNQAQQNICIEVPASMPILRRAEKIVGAECAWQFRKNKWNCTGVESTIFGQPHLQGEDHYGVANYASGACCLILLLRVQSARQHKWTVST